jgi:DNA-binding NarL/FixJ family response regulator
MRLVIAEDSFILRAGLVEILTDRGHEVVAAVGDAEALLAAVDAHRPAVAVIDIRMPPTHTDEGLRAAIQIRADRPDVGILVFSQYIETRYARQLLAGGAGGIGYLLKDRVTNVGEFTDALHRVAAGGTALDPEVVSQLFAVSQRSGSIEALSVREQEVLALIAEGRSNSAISKLLKISEGAVEKHIASMFMRLNLQPSADDNRRVLAVLSYLKG